MSRIVGRVLAAAAAFILISVSARGASNIKAKRKAMTLPEAIAFVRPSVVQLTLMLDHFPAPTSAALGGRIFLTGPLGTGFLVNEGGYVVTALHVLRAFETYQLEIHGQIFPVGGKHLHVGIAAPNMENIRGNFNLVDFDVVEEDARHDLALLKLKQNPLKGEIGAFMKIGKKAINYDVKAATLSPNRSRDGESVAVSGYPLNSSVLISTSGNLASSWAYDIADLPVPGAPSWFRWPDIADSFIADMHVNGGNSGGPVYSVEGGAVIGVCVAFDPAPVFYGDRRQEPAMIQDRPLAYNSGLSVVVPIRYVIDMLKKHDLKWTDIVR